jgi:hypothetical protein
MHRESPGQIEGHFVTNEYGVKAPAIVAALGSTLKRINSVADRYPVLMAKKTTRKRMNAFLNIGNLSFRTTNKKNILGQNRVINEGIQHYTPYDSNFVKYILTVFAVCVISINSFEPFKDGGKFKLRQIYENHRSYL